MDAEEVLRAVETAKVHFIWLQFTDILGQVKSVAIPAEELPRAFGRGVRFDGSSVQGFVRIEESDMFLRPDPDTFCLYPWSAGESRAARLICDVCRPDGGPFEGCPRYVLKRVTGWINELGYDVEVGPEAEFFLFKRDDQGRPLTVPGDRAGYFDLSFSDPGEEARRQMVIVLRKMGFPIEASHHEGSPGQHEIDFRHADPLTTADRIATLRLVVRRVAQRYSLHATFMPKPLAGVNGSGLHLHLSLHQGGRNAFSSPREAINLSSTARAFIAGLIAHAPGFTALTNPLVNSYKRIVTGFEAPVYLAWSECNRSPLVRIPAERGEETRVELRSPDPSCNPYLALAAVLWSGVDGVTRELTPPPPVSANLYQLSAEELADAGIERLPSTLGEALEAFRRDGTVRQALGPHVAGKYLQAKLLEWDVYRSVVDRWELDQYLEKF